MSDWATAFKRVTITGVMAGAVVLGISFVLGMLEGLTDSVTPDLAFAVIEWAWVACLLAVVISGLGWLLAWLKTKM